MDDNGNTFLDFQLLERLRDVGVRQATALELFADNTRRQREAMQQLTDEARRHRAAAERQTRSLDDVVHELQGIDALAS